MMAGDIGLRPADHRCFCFRVLLFSLPGFGELQPSIDALLRVCFSMSLAIGEQIRVRSDKKMVSSSQAIDLTFGQRRS